MKRYHPALVALHWLMALLIIVMLVMGNLFTGPAPNPSPEKIEALTGHIAVGLSIGVLLIIRLFVRVRTEKPPHASTGNAILDKIGVGTHHVMYLLVAIMVLSGLGMALGAGLFDAVYGGTGDIPADLSDRLPAIVHDTTAGILALLALLHIAAAIYHQVGLKDRLMARMWFGKRS